MQFKGKSMKHKLDFHLIGSYIGEDISFDGRKNNKEILFTNPRPCCMIGLSFDVPIPSLFLHSM